MRRADKIELDDSERERLEEWLRSATCSARQKRIAKVLLLADAKAENIEIAARVGCSRQQCARIRKAFVAGGIDDLERRLPSRGRPRKIAVKRVVETTRFTKPREGRYWTRSRLAKEAGVSPSTIGRRLREYGLVPLGRGAWRRYRNKLGLSRAEFARKIGTSAAGVQALLNGSSLLTPAMAFRLFLSFGHDYVPLLENCLMRCTYIDSSRTVISSTPDDWRDWLTRRADVRQALKELCDELLQDTFEQLQSQPLKFFACVLETVTWTARFRSSIDMPQTTWLSNSFRFNARGVAQWKVAPDKNAAETVRQQEIRLYNETFTKLVADERNPQLPFIFVVDVITCLARFRESIGVVCALVPGEPPVPTTTDWLAGGPEKRVPARIPYWLDAVEYAVRGGTLKKQIQNARTDLALSDTAPHRRLRFRNGEPMCFEGLLRMLSAMKQSVKRAPRDKHLL